jgi:nitrogenase molybdenum-iron protein NifN
VPEIAQMGAACASIEFGRVLAEQESAGEFLRGRFGIRYIRLGLPIGVRETDTLFTQLEDIAGVSVPEKYVQERERLLDAYVDGHKYVRDGKAAVYGEEDLVVALASFLNEIGMIPAICASGGQSGFLKRKIAEVIPNYAGKGILVLDNTDFAELDEIIQESKPDLLIGNSKGYAIARKVDIPLVRVGFPIHDRLSGARILHVGYRGTQYLFDRITDELLAQRQEAIGKGFSYL